jgi:Na+-translocating ferredoxin:NAD+ oxidoreductase RnfE subunit
MAASPRPTLVQALAVFVPGLVISSLSIGRAVAVYDSTDPDPSMTPVIVLCGGALLFSVGLMLMLVVIFRPLFGRRKVDDVVDELYGTRKPGA